MTRSEARASDTTSSVSRYSLAPFMPGGTCRWTSPELLIPENYGMTDDRPTIESDCWALGMVIYEVRVHMMVFFTQRSLDPTARTQVLSGHSPYHKFTQQVAVNEILEGKRPKKPRMAARRGFTRELWEVLEQCWAEDRNQRPALDVVLSTLYNAAPFWKKRKSIRTLVVSVRAQPRLK